MPIVLTATAIAGGNEWLQSGQLPWRIGVAGLTLGLVFSGFEKLSPVLTMGVSFALLATALVTPFHGNSPVQEFAQFIGTAPPTPPKNLKQRVVVRHG